MVACRPHREIEGHMTHADQWPSNLDSQAAAKSEGGVAPARAAVQQAVKKARTFLFCFRAVWATVISRSANRLPRSLCVPNERLLHMSEDLQRPEEQRAI